MTVTLKVLVITSNEDCVNNFLRDWRMLGFLDTPGEEGSSCRRMCYLRQSRAVNAVLINNNYLNIAGCVMRDPDVIIIDEAHLFFSESEDSMRYIRLTEGYAGTAERVIIMTATPTRYRREDIKKLNALGELLLKKDRAEHFDLEQFLEKNGSSMPYSFDLTCPVTRYFKDTVERSNLAEGFRQKRIEPVVCGLPDGDGFFRSAAECIGGELEKGNRCIVFVRTFNSTEKPHSTVRACGAENLPTEKKKPSETLTERFRELAVIRFNRVCARSGMLHNSDYDLCGTENGCANRLWLLNQFTKISQNLMLQQIF